MLFVLSYRISLVPCFSIFGDLFASCVDLRPHKDGVGGGGESTYPVCHLV